MISSGATNEGVPRIADEAADKLGIRALGVTSEKAADFPLAKMNDIIVSGKDWGAESAIFLRTSDEVFVLGGGGQAEREALAAATEFGKSVSVFEGYGGAADKVAARQDPLIRVVTRKP